MKTDILLHGDCLELMKEIPDASIDAIICDLPYGTTRNKWDSVIPLDALWKQYKRIIKPRGAIVLFGQCPFDKVLACSNLPMLRYEWIWVKEQGTGHLNSHFAPMKKHENILVFSHSSAGQCSRTPDKAMVYNPQYRKGKAYECKNGRQSKNYDTKHCRQIVTKQDGNHYMPVDVIPFARDKGKDVKHPTQKPVALLRYLIRTYTKLGGVILDNCCGSGSTLIAAIREHRHYIGMELNEQYYRDACAWIARETSQPEIDFGNG